MKLTRNLFGIAALSICLGFASCSDDELPYSEATVTNAQLKTILEKQGIQFDEMGHMLLDDKVEMLTKLDLTGTKFTDFNALTILPNLNELDLSDNEFGPTFDFSVLPAQITGVDLTGNKIYDFENLVKVVVPEEGGDPIVTNLRDVKKLHAPATMKGNFDDMVYFFLKNKSDIDAKTIDFQMADETGALKAYTTLRDVPEEGLRTQLQGAFGSIFEGDQIDMTKHLSLEESSRGIQMMAMVHDFEGIQYIVQNPSWKGASLTLISMYPNTKTPYFTVPASVATIQFIKLDQSAGMDLSKAEGLRMYQSKLCGGLKTIDLSHSKTFGQRDFKTEVDPFTGSGLMVVDNPDVEEILLPESNSLRAYTIAIEMLPSLKKFEFNRFSGLDMMQIGDLNDAYDLVYPNLVEFSDRENHLTTLVVSQKTYDLASTKAFIKKYYTDANPKRIAGWTSLNSSNNKGVNWWD